MQHVTLATGHVRQSPRAEISGRILKLVRKLTHEGGRLPHPLEDYEIKWTAPPAVGACMYSVLRIGGADGPIPLVTCGVALDDEAGARLWELLVDAHRRAMRTEPPAHRPGAPWCGVVIHPTAMLDPAAMEWIGDFERCLAWAWIERRQQR